MNANSLRGVLLVTLAYALVGASFTANSLLGDYPYAGGQALRYAAACLLLLPLLGGRPGLAPLRLLTARHWVRLAALAAVGMVGFNLAVLAAERTAEPAVPGVLVGCAPVVVAVLVPLAEGRRPARAVLYGALLVAAGALAVQGWGRTDLAGIGYSVAALAGEVGFTVLAVPVLRVLGPKLLTAVVCGIGAAESALLGLAVDGTDVLRMPTAVEAGALVWQAALATVVGFVLFYMGVQRIGVERATLYTGAIPVAAALSAALVGTAAFGLPQAAGALLVGAGAALGTGLFTRRRATGPTPAAQDVAGDGNEALVPPHDPAAGQLAEPGAGERRRGAHTLPARQAPVPGAPDAHGPARDQRLVKAGGATRDGRPGHDHLG
jgi:drug/metabolite transporter (DMT)-like permease